MQMEVMKPKLVELNLKLYTVFSALFSLSLGADCECMYIHIRIRCPGLYTKLFNSVVAAAAVVIVDFLFLQFFFLVFSVFARVSKKTKDGRNRKKTCYK